MHPTPTSRRCVSKPHAWISAVRSHVSAPSVFDGTDRERARRLAEEVRMHDMSLASAVTKHLERAGHVEKVECGVLTVQIESGRATLLGRFERAYPDATDGELAARPLRVPSMSRHPTVTHSCVNGTFRKRANRVTLRMDDPCVSALTVQITSSRPGSCA
ncbi:hypothetical protein SCHPADRAFT_416244 [Schizopora paradoxa]|uniref:Uncharacterized protein n=1 Tax=Schizopora paradoxa TaxID=27342 RepID=A0A0H2RSP9_9AGAM|nr:hypothetical protein SCHPADRAFT_416244 [Schizopora paradoxa]